MNGFAELGTRNVELGRLRTNERGAARGFDEYKGSTIFPTIFRILDLETI